MGKPKLKARVCERCGKSKGVTFHALQTLDGSMRSVCAHLACFKLTRAETEKLRFGRKLFSAFREDDKS